MKFLREEITTNSNNFRIFIDFDYRTIWTYDDRMRVYPLPILLNATSIWHSKPWIES